MLNSCIFEGRLVADPELRKTATGTFICNFKIAVDRTIKKEGKPALFLPITLFGATAENAVKHFRKGRAIIVTGRLENDEYIDKDTKEKKTTFYLNGSSFEFPLTERQSDKPAGSPPNIKGNGVELSSLEPSTDCDDGLDGIDVVSDDLPF